MAEATASHAGLLLPNVMGSTLPESDHNDGDEELCTSSVGSASVAKSDLRGELVRLSASLCVGKRSHTTVKILASSSSHRKLQQLYEFSPDWLFYGIGELETGRSPSNVG